MSSIANDVIGGFNHLINEQKKNGPDAKVTFVQFDSQDPQHVIVAGAPISEITDLTSETFIPTWRHTTSRRNWSFDRASTS